MLNVCDAINRFYRSEAWQLARQERIVAANGCCEKCGAPGEEVHHIIHLTPENVDDPNVTLNQKNLILLCKECHNKEHGRFRKTILFDAEGNIIPPGHQNK